MKIIFTAAWLLTFIFSIESSAQFGFKKKLPTTGSNVNLKETAAFTAAEKKLQSVIKKVNSKCKLKIAGKFDRKSFAGKLKEADLKLLAGPACEEAMLAFASVCNNKTIRAKTKQVKEYTCSYAPQSQLKLIKKQNLNAMVNPGGSNLDKFKVDIMSVFK